MNDTMNYINGDWVVPDRALPGQLADANSGSPLAPQLGSSGKQVEAALAAAHLAYTDGRWSDIPATERAQKLLLGGSDEFPALDKSGRPALGPSVLCEQAAGCSAFKAPPCSVRMAQSHMLLMQCLRIYPIASGDESALDQRIVKPVL